MSGNADLYLALSWADKSIKEYRMADCLFCRIVRGEIPCRKVFEDDEVLAFHDINPVAPVHFMLVPKLHLATLAEAGDAHAALLGKMMLLAPKLAKEQGLDNGFRTVINTGKGGGQEIFHLHVHVIGGGNIPPMVRRN
jgi:histidine triad (HIT) family protein